MEDAATLAVLQAIQNRSRPPVPDYFRQQGTVQKIINGQVTVIAADGSRVFVPLSNVNTNGEIRGRTVLLTRTTLGDPFISSEIRG